MSDTKKPQRRIGPVSWADKVEWMSPDEAKAVWDEISATTTIRFIPKRKNPGESKPEESNRED